MKKTIFLLRLEVHRSPGDFIEFPDGLVKVTSVSFLSLFFAAVITFLIKSGLSVCYSSVFPGTYKILTKTPV